LNVYYKQLSNDYVEIDKVAKLHLSEISSHAEQIKLLNIDHIQINKINSIIDTRFSVKMHCKMLKRIIDFIKDIPIHFVFLFFPLNYYLDFCLFKKIIRVLNNYDTTENDILHIPLIKDLTESEQITEIVQYNILLDKIDQFKNDDQYIIFDNVTFGYDADKLIFDQQSLKIKKHTSTLMIGPNGCGKSTLMKLLLKLYEPSSGHIYVNDINLNRYPNKLLRKLICYLNNEPKIFNKTIKQNIFLGIDKNKDTLSKYLTLLNCEEWYNNNKNKIVDFKCKNLTGGEKRRIQLLNMLCGDYETIIFDEPTNVLDSNGIKWFANFISHLIKEENKTIIILSHDLRIMEHVNNVVHI